MAKLMTIRLTPRPTPSFLRNPGLWLAAVGLFATGCQGARTPNVPVNRQPTGDLHAAAAHWVARDLIAWNAGGAGDHYTLHYAAGGGLSLGDTGVTGADGSVELAPAAGGLPPALAARFPHLAGYIVLELDPAQSIDVRELLRGQLAVTRTDAAGKPPDATGLQIPGVLDELYAHEDELGPVFAGATPTIRLWAPTAKSVQLQLFAAADADAFKTVAMTRDANTGTWSVTGAPDWNRGYYRFDVEVYVPTTGRVEHNLVTDPYSLSLSTNSALSQLVNLDDPSLMPPGWVELRKPPLAAPEDIVIYELHVRDFSSNDPTVPAEYRGTYKAFTVENGDGRSHLESLAAAGLTHLHLLPTFDIASIGEDRDGWRQPDPGSLARFAPDSSEQQAAVAATAAADAYNWGYDPWHYTVPEGSYATDAAGVARILEYREMVEALNEAGLRVVMDVVYNHTAASGQDGKSVLDRIVPGYYHRLGPTGAVEKSTCCENTAAEHAMMEKLMVDSLLTWARDYKVDGFRFDLMGHHPKSTILRIRAALDALTIAKDGVDGSAIYVYGEGWNFGEVADDARFEQATQANLAGTGIGTFNDRLRDGARGGNPFTDLRDQGFINGLAYDPNAAAPDDAVTTLRHSSDWLRAGLAGNLAQFSFENAAGEVVAASELDYFGQPAAYTADPQENIAYVEAHDNQTLFDSTQLKAPAATTLADRARIQQLGASLAMFAQGVPFFHAGQDILRSKSLDKDSYDSGDWFNAIDWNLATTNWGKGLPPANRNEDDWPLMQPLLADRAIAPDAALVGRSAALFRELLQIRRSSPLFRLRTAEEIVARVRFHNTGPGQLPGLIVMSIADDAADLDPAWETIVTLFNAGDVTFRGRRPVRAAPGARCVGRPGRAHGAL